MFRSFAAVVRPNLRSLRHPTVRRQASVALNESHESHGPAFIDHLGREPVVFRTSRPEETEAYWQKIPKWSTLNTSEFLNHKWQMANSVQSQKALLELLHTVLPSEIIPQTDLAPQLRLPNVRTKDDFIQRVSDGMQKAPMAVRLSPHIISTINWQDPLNDPIRRQFIPLYNPELVDHPAALLDPMHEGDYSPVQGLIHRYPDRALFLGSETESIKKQRFLPILKKWEARFEYIERTPTLTDIIISGGDTYILEPSQIRHIGERLLSIPHVQRFRFATKGLAVSPARMLDPNDEWVSTIIELENKARKMGKHVCIHTHFNSVNEITWVTRQGAQRLYENGVTVRNQTVLLNGVNNTPDKLLALVKALGKMNIQPYYVYQGDIVPGAEDLRTPMSDSLALERAVRGNTAGFLVPQFILDLPAEGGKRLTSTVFDYDRHTGHSKMTAPGLRGDPVTMHYWDPLWSLSDDGREEVMRQFKKT